jgi:hydrogenase maturation protease
MNTMRILIAGIGNIFLGDDAFGVEVVRQLANRQMPSDVRVVDFGIRGIDLAYALLDPYERIILVDAVPRGGQPGTLYLIEPLTENVGPMQTHEMTPAKVLASAKAMGAALTNVILIGCEPESFGTDDEPQVNLSRAVAAAVPEAVAMIETMVAKTAATAHA